MALAWPNHVHHDAAASWFHKARKAGWATCPATQAGFVRVSSNARAIPGAASPRTAFEVLGRITALSEHRFYSDDIDLPTSSLVFRERIVGYRQVTDAHLLAVALRNGGRLATFDRGLFDLVPSGTDPVDAVVLLGATPQTVERRPDPGLDHGEPLERSNRKALVTGITGQDGQYLTDLLLGEPSKAKKLLGWQPTVTFEGLVEMMTKADLELAAGESGSRTKS